MVSGTSDVRPPGVNPYRVDADALLRAAGSVTSGGWEYQNYAHPLVKKWASTRPKHAAGRRAVGGQVSGDASILGNDDAHEPPAAAVNEVRGVDFLAQVLVGARYKMAEAQQQGARSEGQFRSFRLPNGDLLEPHLPQSLIKSALTAMPYTPVPQPGLQQAQQAMTPFLPAPAAGPQITPQAPPIPNTAAGMPAAAPGHQTLTGVAQRPIGLDQPCDTRATAMPGTPGHAATNVIDQQGGLDPRGMTIDGNNAAGIKKLGSDTAAMHAAYAQIMARPGANWFTASIYDPHTVVGQLNLMARMTSGRDKQAVDQSTRQAVDQSTQNDLHGFKVAMWLGQQDEKKKNRGAGGSAPWMGLGLGAGAMGAYGLSQGMATDQQIGRIRKSVADYKPEAFTQGQLPPNQTGLTHYQNLLSPAAQLKPFGMPIGKALVGVRSDPQVMEAMGAKDYALKTPAEQQGVMGMAHYNMFSGGPVPAYMHQIKAKFADTPVPATLGVPEGTRYSDWMGRKLEDFVAQHAGQRINPFEMTTQFMPHEQQSQLMEQFHASLPPEVQAYRVQAEDPGAGYAKQVENYLPKAKGYADFRDTLKNVGIAGGGAAAGAVGGHMLYNGLTNDEDETATGRTMASMAGAGLGGGAAYLGGTDHGRQLLGSGVQGLKNLLLGTKAASDNRITALQAKGHGLRICTGCGAKQQCRCMRQHHDNLDIPDRTVETCSECDGSAAERRKKMDEMMTQMGAEHTQPVKAAGNAVSTGRFITCDELLNYKPTGPVNFATFDQLRVIMAADKKPSTGAALQVKQSHVAPFRPINADPDFIAANQAWHAAEKAKIAEGTKRMSDPIYRALVNNFSTFMGLGNVA